jgi:hypothetical protein
LADKDRRWTITNITITAHLSYQQFKSVKAKVIHLVLDNFKIHDSRATRAAVQESNGRLALHFLPPYCPDHNKIERVWLDLHANVTRNHRCADMSDLMANVDNYLRNRNQRTDRTIKQAP